MRKLLTGIFAALSICFLASTDVQAQAFEKENMVVNLGIGFGGTNSAGYGTLGTTISLSGEKGFMETGDFGIIGLGALVGYRKSSNTFLTGGGLSVTSLLIAPRGTYHFSVIPVEKLDVYAAVEMGIAIVTIKNDFSNTSVSDTDFHPSLIAGARYYFSEKFGAFAEVGINGFAGLTGGISYKF